MEPVAEGHSLVLIAPFDVFSSRHHRLDFAHFACRVKFVLVFSGLGGFVELIHLVVDGEIKGVGEELFGAALLAQYFVVHASVAQQGGLSAGRGVVFVVKVLYGVGGEGRHTIARRDAAQPEFVEVFVESFNLVGHLDARHGDEHFLEGLVIGEGQHSHFTKGDGFGMEADDERVAGGEAGVDGDEAA